MIASWGPYGRMQQQAFGIPSCLRTKPFRPCLTFENSFFFFFFFWSRSFVKALRQDPLEAILVIFGRRALIFFCLKALEQK